jgi:hypothetical protein
VDKGFSVGHNGLGLVRALTWFWAAHWGGDACVGGKFEA